MRPTLIGVILALLVVPLNAQEVAGPDEYAYGFPIQLENGTRASDFYSVELPLAVYQSVTDAQLRDLGVYDGANQPVPRVLRRSEPTVENDETKAALRFFPLPANEATAADDIRVLLQKGNGSTRVELTSSGVEPVSAHRYVVDTQSFEQPFQAVDFEWAEVPTTFVAMVNIEGSQDLDRWTGIGNGAIANLQSAGNNVLQQRVSLTGGRFDYLRITVTDAPDSWQLTGTTGIELAKTSTVERRWETLQPTATDEDGGLIFDLGGNVPIDRLQIKLSEDNSVVRGVLYYRTGDRWVRWREGVFYHLKRNGRAITNEPIAISERRNRRFKFKILTGGTNVPVQLIVGWRPEKLIFLAQGQQPYTLVAGNSEERAAGFPQARRYGDPAIFDLALNQDIATLAVANLGPRAVLGGTDRLRASEQRDWRQIALWAALVLAVLVVGWIAVSLLRQVNSDDAAPQR